jgi:molecular chaperone DnaJ
MAHKDYYQILGVEKTATEDEIKNQYRKLAKKYHPDRYANASDEERKEAEEKFKEISEAYDVLTNPEKKQKYEQTGSYDGFSFEGFGNTGMDDIDEMLNRFRGGFNPFGGGPFGGGFGGFEAKKQQQQKPATIKLKLSLSIEDAYNGVKKRIRYKRFKPCKTCNASGLGKDGRIDVCPVCGGTGYEVLTQSNGWMTQQQMITCRHCNGTGTKVINPCKDCNGTGRVVETEEIDVNVPVGVANGAYIILKDMGNYAERNSSLIGDLMVMFEIKQDGKYQINGTDLITTAKIPILDCITGGEIELPFLNNEKVKVKIPMGTKHGDAVTVSGKGMMNTIGRGKLVVVVEQVYPKSLSSYEEKALKELKDSKNFKK